MMDVRSYEAGKIRNERIWGTTKVGEIAKEVHAGKEVEVVCMGVM